MLCYNSSTCAAAGEFANAMSIEDCCSNNPDGLTFRRLYDSDPCEPCIGMCNNRPYSSLCFMGVAILYLTSCTTVYGFFNDSFTQPEQGQGYMVRVGYMKGAALSGINLIFDVMDTPGTASEITTLSINVLNVEISQLLL